MSPKSLEQDTETKPKPKLEKYFEKLEKSISNASFFNFLYPINNNFSGTNEIIKQVQAQLAPTNFDNFVKQNIMDILTPTLIGKDKMNKYSINSKDSKAKSESISENQLRFFKQISSQIIRLGRLLSIDNPFLLDNYSLDYNLSSDNAEPSISIDIKDQENGRDKRRLQDMAKGDKVRRSLARISKSIRKFPGNKYSS